MAAGATETATKALANVLWLAAFLGLLAATTVGRLAIDPDIGPVVAMALALSLLGYYFYSSVGRITALPQTAHLTAHVLTASCLKMGLLGAVLGGIWVLGRSSLIGAGPTVLANPWLSFAAAAVAFLLFAGCIRAAAAHVMGGLPQHPRERQR